MPKEITAHGDVSSSSSGDAGERAPEAGLPVFRASLAAGELVDQPARTASQTASHPTV